MNSTTATSAVDMLHELIRKHEECIHEIQVMTARDFPKGTPMSSQTLCTREPGATPHETVAALKFVPNGYTPNCTDAALLQNYLKRLCDVLWDMAIRYISNANSPYGVNDLWKTREGRREWETRNWSNWGIPQMVYDRLGKYPSHINHEGIYRELKPYSDWDLEKRISDWEESVAASEAHKKWYASLTPKEQKEWNEQMRKEWLRQREAADAERRSAAKKAAQAKADAKKWEKYWEQKRRDE